MAQYRRKSTVVEAEQFTDPASPPRGVSVGRQRDEYTVVTMQGRVVPVSIGEWVVTESDGEHHYPVADAEFRRIYAALRSKRRKSAPAAFGAV